MDYASNPLLETVLKSIGRHLSKIHLRVPVKSALSGWSSAAHSGAADFRFGSGAASHQYQDRSFA
jgi:hypothetical protein